jgi:hypothetical protein
LSLLCIKHILSGHSAAQGVKHLLKFTSGFIGSQILNFERRLNLEGVETVWEGVETAWETTRYYKCIYIRPDVSQESNNSQSYLKK